MLRARGMELKIGNVWALAALTLLCLCSGCVNSEQDVARNLDWTHQVVQQATDIIASDPELGHFAIVVDGFKGQMRLKGSVATEQQRERAAKIVWGLRGVRSVENALSTGAAAQARH